MPRPIDVDYERLSRAYSMSARPFGALAQWLRHLEWCNTAGCQIGTCTCGLMTTLDGVAEWLKGTPEKQATLAQSGFVAHMPHCEASRTENCSCGLHSAFPALSGVYADR